MEFLQALLVAAVPSVAAVATAWLGFRDLAVRRRLDTSKQFLTLFATAHGRPTDGRERVGVGEQIATLNLIADFAVKEPMVRHAATEGLKHFTTWDKSLDDSGDEIVSRPEQEAVESVSHLHRGKSNQGEIAQAAWKALKRVQCMQARRSRILDSIYSILGLGGRM